MPKVQVGLTPNISIVKKDKIHTLLEPGELGAMLDWKVWDPKSGKIQEEVSKKSESFVRQFLELLFAAFAGSVELNPYNLRDTGNVLRDVVLNSITFQCNAAVADATLGIIVGTGNTAPTINDYVIETLIQHDAAPPTAGRLQYGDVSFGLPASDATTSQFTITRNFANASGGAITVEEVALYVEAGIYGTTYYFMAIRDVTGGINVPNGQTLTINYRIQGVI